MKMSHLWVSVVLNDTDTKINSIVIFNVHEVPRMLLKPYISFKYSNGEDIIGK